MDYIYINYFNLLKEVIYMIGIKINFAQPNPLQKGMNLEFKKVLLVLFLIKCTV